MRSYSSLNFSTLSSGRCALMIGICLWVVVKRHFACVVGAERLGTVFQSVIISMKPVWLAINRLFGLSILALLLPSYLTRRPTGSRLSQRPSLAARWRIGAS